MSIDFLYEYGDVLKKKIKDYSSEEKNQNVYSFIKGGATSP